jgi:hypothetical protein
MVAHRSAWDHRIADGLDAGRWRGGAAAGAVEALVVPGLALPPPLDPGAGSLDLGAGRTASLTEARALASFGQDLPSVMAIITAA